MQEGVEKLFKTGLSVNRFQVIATKSCRGPVSIRVEGFSKHCIPGYRLLNVTFKDVDDRDRFMIALRFAEDEMRKNTISSKPPASGRVA